MLSRVIIKKGGMSGSQSGLDKGASGLLSEFIIMQVFLEGAITSEWSNNVGIKMRVEILSGGTILVLP